MSWLQILILVVAAYLLIATYIRNRGLFADHIMFYGPIMAIKTDKVAIFDWFTRFRTVLRGYGTAGAVTVVLISVFMAVMLIAVLPQYIIQPPEPTGIHDPRNILTIPGVNQAIPFTFAVWFGLVFTIVVHEFGHAVLARVEDMRVKSMGLLIAVVPISAFVEPDEEDVERAEGMPKIRMFGAGITNNLVAAFACFAVMFLLLGMAVPTAMPLIQGVYRDYPAAEAGVPGYSIIREINGVPVSTQDDVARFMETTRPGDRVSLTVEKDGTRTTYRLTLAEWPEALSDHDSGFMGVYYYNAGGVESTLQQIANPAGALILMLVPFDVFMWGNQMQLDVLVIDTPAAVAWDAPFTLFWVLIQILFWSGWFNLAVGTFNALPLVPLDGGYIMKEAIERLFERWGLSRYAPRVVASISGLMLFALVVLVTLPYIAWMVRSVFP